jgi:hypothetical protein
MARPLLYATRQLVLHGLATTRMRTSFAALAASARPWAMKISAFLLSRSLRSMPALRGKPPTSTAQLQSRNALFGSSVRTMSCSVGKLQSPSSIATPSSVPIAGGISSSCRITFCFGPNTSPEASRPTSG